MRIPVYAAEIEAGIGDLIATSASLAYLTKPQCAEADLLKNKALALQAIQQNMAKASTAQEAWDLFYMKDIMVSAGWNENDDIFTLAELWAAKDTPEDKPFNLIHNGTDIIGHIIGQHVIDDKGNVVEASSIDELPERIHVVSNSVIYRWWNNVERREAIAKVIEEILDTENKEPWFVSMEAVFSNFDYALVDEKTAKAIVLPRNSSTAYLSKQLKAYGGKGTYKDYKVGRILKNITFSGKGLVKNPANKNSIIFNTTKPFFAKENINLEDGFGYTNSSDKKSKENKMTELEILAKQLEEIKATLNSEKASKAELEKQLKEVSVASSQARLDDLNKNLKDSTDKLNAVVAEVNQLKTEKAELVTKAEKLEKELETAKVELAKASKAKLDADRVAVLAKEVNAEKAQALYDVVADANLSDDKFNIYVANMKANAAYVTPEDKKKEEEKKKKDAAKKKAKADSDVGNLEEPEVDADASLNLGGADNELEEARASIANYYRASRGRVTVEKAKE